MMTGRRYRLLPWLVRCLLPDHVIGTYVLWDHRRPLYAGRSDTSLQRRLIEHAHAYRDTYFSFDVTHNAELAFNMECSLFHALDGDIRNLIHPGRPGFSAAVCPFCRDNLPQARAARLPEALTVSQ